VKRVDNEKIIAIEAEPDQIAQSELWPDITKVQTTKLAIRYRHDRGPIGIRRPKIGLNFIERRICCPEMFLFKSAQDRPSEKPNISVAAANMFKFLW
jgi:hypothetical protein